MEQLRTANHRTLTTKKVWKVAIYLRLSQEDGKDESLSVSNQRKIIYDYLETDFSGKYEVVETYIDDGISGVTTTHRPDFLRMISDVEAGRVDTIICKSLSRAFRNTGDQNKHLREVFPQYQTRFITIDTPYIDTFLNPRQAYSMEVEFHGMFNGNYPILISEEVNKTFRAMRKRGEATSGYAPYGYVKGDTEETKNKFFIDEEAAKIVRNIYQWYVYDGMSQLGIVKKLNSLGTTTPTERKKQLGINYFSNHKKLSGMWTAATISRILKNESYIGNMVQGREKVVSPVLKTRVTVDKSEWVIVENTHEPIVSKELFEKAQKLQATRRRTPKNERVPELFSGVLYCADCGMRMNHKKSVKQLKTGEKTYRHYVCSTFAMRSKEACSNHCIRYEDLKGAILSVIQDQIKTVDGLAKIISKAEKKKVASNDKLALRKNLSTKQTELTNTERISDDLYIDWKTGTLSKDEYMRMKSSFEEKISHLKQIIQAIQKEIEEKENNNDIVMPYLETFLEYKSTKELTRPMLIDLVERIEVHEDKSISINFRFADVHDKITQAFTE